MARIITKELALRIVSKLKATRIRTRNSAHDEYAVEHDGLLIAILSIRRGSDKDLGHDYIPRELFLSSGQAKRLAQCPLSREGYLAILREKNLLPDSDPPPEPAA